MKATEKEIDEKNRLFNQKMCREEEAKWNREAGVCQWFKMVSSGRFLVDVFASLSLYHFTFHKQYFYDPRYVRKSKKKRKKEKNWKWN